MPDQARSAKLRIEAAALPLAALPCTAPPACGILVRIPARSLAHNPLPFRKTVVYYSEFS
jgi:hypothetical protein